MAYQSKLQIFEVPAPHAAQVGITEEISYVNKVDIRRTVNGDALVVTSPFDRKARFKITASGLAIRAEPALLGIKLGGFVTLHSSIYQTFWIPAGAPSVTLDHQVVPGSRVVVERVDHGGLPITCSAAGAVVSIDQGIQDIMVIFRVRLVYDAVLAAHTKAAQEVEGTQTWSGDYEEA